MRGYAYTDEQRDFIVQHGNDMNTRELAHFLNAEFGVNHTEQSVRTVAKKLGVLKSKQCRSRSCAERGEPIGSEKIVGNYRYIKVRMSGGGFYKDWEREITLNYRKAYGEIPEGYMIVTLNGNKLDASPENLMAIPKSVAARMANGHGKSMWSEFPEITKTAIKWCELQGAIKSALDKTTIL